MKRCISQSTEFTVTSEQTLRIHQKNIPDLTNPSQYGLPRRRVKQHSVWHVKSSYLAIAAPKNVFSETLSISCACHLPAIRAAAAAALSLPVSADHLLCLVFLQGQGGAGWIFFQAFPGGDALDALVLCILSRMLSFKLSTSPGQGSSWFVQTWK